MIDRKPNAHPSKSDRFRTCSIAPSANDSVPLLIVLGVVALWRLCGLVLSIPKVIAEAHWERVGIYLSQWVSYDVKRNSGLRATRLRRNIRNFRRWAIIRIRIG